MPNHAPNPRFIVCRNKANTGICNAVECLFSHDIHLCHTCRVYCSSQYHYNKHLGGKKHKEELRKANQLAVAQEDSDDDALGLSGTVDCRTCNTKVPQEHWTAHLTSFNHRKKERFMQIHAAFEEAEKDKHGISVVPAAETGVDFGFLEIDRINYQSTKELDVVVSLSTSGTVYLSEAYLSSSRTVGRRRPCNFEVTLPMLPVRVTRQQPLDIEITFDSHLLPGRSADRLELIFQDHRLGERFSITRTINAVVGSEADWNVLKPTAPYKPKARKTREAEREITEGVRPPALAKIKWVVPLPQAPIPGDLEGLVVGRDVKAVLRDVRRTRLPRDFTRETYGRWFSTLLHLEEITMKSDIERYDMENAPMNPAAAGCYSLIVPGLAEKRPSVIVGDRILVQNAGSKKSGKWFEGYVHKVGLADVYLKFHASFNSYPGQKYNIRFQVSRLPLRRMHQALATNFNPSIVLFPTATDLRAHPPSDDLMEALRLVDRKIATNRPQLLAVAAIKELPRESPPFIIFGPPGTGKTVTAVEAMRQILLEDPTACILACAPSNSAADIIAERLAQTLSINQLFRLNAPSRDKASLPRALEQFSLSNDEGTFSVPLPERLCTYRVIVSTCFSASVPYGVGLPRGHFTHIFIDEAGQASEPEAMIPIKDMADNDTRIILSGDPKQLGPIIRSAPALELGLGVSFLDRLMTRDPYDPARYSGISVVKLTKNWRSHPAILKYPNEQFYLAELEPHGDQAVTHSLLRSDLLVKKNFPVVFHGLQGKDMREAASPSFFNADEASQVKRYVQELKGDQKLRLKDEHIGIIAPYHAQVLKIRQLLKSFAPHVKVGSVEEFQGQERRVIIMSPVRSSIDFIGYDIRHTLGFVASPRRFNVSVTRAQALLIVVGDPSVLSLDPLWRGFMNYIHQAGGWKGVQPDWDTTEPVRLEGGYDVEVAQGAMTDMELLVERTRAIVLQNLERLVDDTEDDGVGAVDRPWREAD